MLTVGHQVYSPIPAAMVVKGPSAANVRVCVQRFTPPADLSTLTLDRPCEASGAEVTSLSGTLILPADSATTTPIDLIALPVEAGQIVVIRAESDLAFDPADLTLAPRAPETPLAAYAEVCLPNADGTALECTTDAQVLASAPLDTGRFGLFTAIPRGPPAIPYVAPAAGTLRVAAFPASGAGPGPNSDPTPFLVAARSNQRGTLWLRDCTRVSCGATVAIPALAVLPGESITFEIATPEGAHGTWLAAALDGTSVGLIPLTARALADTSTARAPGPRRQRACRGRVSAAQGMV